MSRQEFIDANLFTIIKEKYRGNAFPDEFSYTIFRNGAYVMTCRTGDDADRIISYLTAPIFPKQKEHQDC